MLKRPQVTPFARCPNCRRLIAYGLLVCPDCREELSEEYALLSAAVHTVVTQACSSANDIKTGEPAAVFALLASAYGYFLGAPALLVVSFVSPLVALLVISVWLYRYRRFKIAEEEFVRARRRMWASLRLWLALLVVQTLYLIYLVKVSHSWLFGK